MSIFTHLSEKGHQEWFRELYRITKPGGAAFITTQGKSYARKLSNNERIFFDKGELVIRGNVYEGNRLYSAFQPECFIKKSIEHMFDIITFIPGSPDNKFEQDIWILSRK